MFSSWTYSVELFLIIREGEHQKKICKRDTLLFYIKAASQLDISCSSVTFYNKKI